MNLRVLIVFILYTGMLFSKTPKIDPKIMQEQHMQMRNFLQKAVDEETVGKYPEGLPFNLLKEHYQIKNKEGRVWQLRPLDVALEFDKPTLLSQLLEKNIEQAVCIPRSMMLFNAIDRNKHNCALFLIKEGKFNLNATDFLGRTPLMFAVSKDYKIAKALVRAGAQLDIKDSYGKTAEDYATTKCKTKLLTPKDSKEGCGIN